MFSLALAITLASPDAQILTNGELDCTLDHTNSHADAPRPADDTFVKLDIGGNKTAARTGRPGDNKGENA